jgi:hypothetical protein
MSSKAPRDRSYKAELRLPKEVVAPPTVELPKRLAHRDWKIGDRFAKIELLYVRHSGDPPAKSAVDHNWVAFG